MEVIDIHHHLGALNGGSLQAGDGWQDRDYANRVRIMDANGVDAAAILAATGYIQADGIKDTMRSNDVVAAYRQRDPKRFPIACGIVEPLHGDRSLDELERLKRELALDGVVWHSDMGRCFQGFHFFVRESLAVLQMTGWGARLVETKSQRWISSQRRISLPCERTIPGSASCV
jgi:hypothetical protein